MSSGKLLERVSKKSKLKPQKADIDYLNALLDAARKNFDAALDSRAISEEAAFKVFFDGMLQISRVVVLLNGYRPDDGEQHKTTFAAAGEILGPEYDDLIRKIQKFRIKRNESVYDPKGLIGRSDAAAIHRTASLFWAKVRTGLEKENPQLKLFKEV